jgi:hypothetical protein
VDIDQGGEDSELYASATFTNNGSYSITLHWEYTDNTPGGHDASGDVTIAPGEEKELFNITGLGQESEGTLDTSFTLRNKTITHSENMEY